MGAGEAFMGKWMTMISGGLFGVFLIGLHAGCTGPGAIQPAVSWHAVKSGCYDTQENRFFYGIGRAAGVQNSTLLRAAADNRARRELAGVLEHYILELARSVPGNLDPNWAMLAFGERRQILGSVVRNAMQRAVICDHWSEPRQGALLSLCRLSLSDFKSVLSASEALNDAMRSAMVSAAERVHARLARKL
jgi:hypothetical protein